MTATTETGQTQPPQETINDFVGNAHGNLARVRELLGQHPGLLTARAVWDETALGAAAHAGSEEVARYLLDQGAPLDLCTAAMLGLTDRVAAFLRDDPALARSTGAHGIPALYHAAIKGRREIAELLVAHGADVNAGAGGNTALHGAARFGQAGLAAWLLDHGADAEATDYEGKTPLQVATEQGHEELADLLRQHGGAE